MSDDTPKTPAHDGNAPLRVHEYDEIQEYDNGIPFWLSMLFLVTVLFAFGYVPYYLLGYALEFDTPQVTLKKEMKAVEDARQAMLAANPQATAAPTEEQLAALVSNPAEVAEGQKQYGTSCAPCHGDKGQGLIGPNLTDNYWLHGGKLTEIRKTIVEGVPAKGMVAWGNVLKPQSVDEVVAYIASIQGSNPPNPKPPQGDQVTAMK